MESPDTTRFWMTYGSSTTHLEEFDMVAEQELLQFSDLSASPVSFRWTCGRKIGTVLFRGFYITYMMIRPHLITIHILILQLMIQMEQT
jgi:hypothetical protein